MDWGLFSAARGTNNWDQRRQDKAMNLAIVEQRSKDEQQKVKQSMAAEEEINKYFDEMSNMDVLAEDQERIREVEKNSRANIIKGIAQNNGDLSKYMSSGGISDMHQYENSILQSQEVQNAKSNKAAMGSIVADKKKGDRWFAPVDVEIQALGPDGQPKVNPETGNPIMTNRKMSIDDQMAMFKAGKINKINYNGSEKKVKLNPFSFKNKPKDSRNPYSKDNVVTASNVKFQAMESGASEAYADKLAGDYVDMVNAGGDSWKWGNKSEEERQIMEAKLKASKGGGRKKSGGVTTLNQRSPQLLSMADSGRESTEKMLPQEREFWMKSKGLNYDSTTNTYRPSYAVAGVDPLTGANYDLSNALSVRPTNDYVTKNGEVYLLTDVVYDADNPQANNPHTESLGWNQLADEESRHSWVHGEAEDFGITEMDGQDVWSGQVLIPVTTEMKGGVFMDGMNKMLGHKSTQEGHYGSATNEDYQQLTQQQIAEGAQQYGVTPEEYLAAMQYNSKR
jgi:hypothetical protein